MSLRPQLHLKIQMTAGASWAVAATAAVESMHLIAFPALDASRVSLSEQQLLSCCDASRGCRQSDGCNGGFPEDVGVGSVEYGVLPSEQQLVSCCDVSRGCCQSDGCNGGFPEDVGVGECGMQGVRQPAQV